jgi:hypothetical protein
MKKCTLILMFILTITACKKEKEDSTTIATETSNTPSNCITLEGYYKLSDLTARKEWLQERGDNVCKDTLEKAVLKIHQVKGKVTNQKGNYSISWGKLKDIIKNHGYDAYLKVVDAKGNMQKIDSLMMAPEYGYENRGFYFSTALIRTLAKKYVKDDNTEFEFSFATLTEKNKGPQSVVVIQIKGNSAEEVPFYDYSTDPTAAPNNNIPL